MQYAGAPAEGFGEPDYWVKRLVRDLEGIEGPIVIDDVRRLNEAEGLRAAGFVIVQVKTPERVRAQRIFDRDGHFDPAWLAHESEQEWPESGMTPASLAWGLSRTTPRP